MKKIDSSNIMAFGEFRPTSIKLEKSKTPFIHTDVDCLMRSAIKFTSSSMTLLVLMEYGNDVYCSTSSLLSQFISNNSMPDRMIVIGTLYNVDSRNIYCLISAIDVIKKTENSIVVDMLTRQDVAVPENVRRDLLVDILAREGITQIAKF